MAKTIDSLMIDQRDRFMMILRDQIDGEPRTSWDNVLNGVLYDFTMYADDEASDQLKEQYERGQIDDSEVIWQFDQFVMLAENINDYDQ